MRWFTRICLVTVIATYCLIGIGAGVRASGAGMGCPDWPLCFGRWLPPTHESQLPPDYRERYIGYDTLTFNATKSWIEYVNRLAGVVIGLLTLTTWGLSLRRTPRRYGLWRYTTAVLVLVLLQGGLGALVVRSELHPLMVTAHMLLAQVIVLLLLTAWWRGRRQLVPMVSTVDADAKSLSPLLPIAMALTCLQIILGAQVREAVDLLTFAAELPRTDWVNALPPVFDIHRINAMVLFVLSAWVVMLALQRRDRTVRRIALALGVVVTLTFLLGVLLQRFAIAPPLQPFHLLLASVILGLQYVLYLFGGKHENGIATGSRSGADGLSRR